MIMRTYTAFLRGKQVKVTSTRLAQFRKFYLAGRSYSKRVSELLLLDLYILDAHMGVSPHDILGEIEALEKDPSKSFTKPATAYTKLPLKGLWHKHYFAAQFLVDNILLGLGKNGLAKLVDEVMDPAKSNIITKEMIEELAHRTIVEPVKKRSDRSKMTGEWIVFLPHGGVNYYLCLNTHGAGDDLIYKRIAENCKRDFPHLLSWIEEARKKADEAP
jgi:hypothetical protein